MQTITIFFDSSDPSNLGYSAQLDLPNRPGIAGDAAVSLTSARRCASGACPPAVVQRAARSALGIGRTRISWERIELGGWRGTLRA